MFDAKEDYIRPYRFVSKSSLIYDSRTLRLMPSLFDCILNHGCGPSSDYQKNIFNDTYIYEEEDIDTLDVPILRLEDAKQDPKRYGEELRKGVAMGAFWVDVGKDQVPEGLFDDIFSFFDNAHGNTRLQGHRYDYKKNLYIQSLMHAVSSGFSFFNREFFQTITVLDAHNKTPSREGFKQKYDDVFKIPSLVYIVDLMQDVTDEVFKHIEAAVGAEPGSLYKSCDGCRGLTLHRTRAVDAGPAHMAAEEHFDFLTANVLFYNYNDGFKIYQNGTWMNITKPSHQMVFFNLGSVLCMRTNRKIPALFHRVDTPQREPGRPDRVSNVLNVSPCTTDIVSPHPNFGKSEFTHHSYQDHVSYAAKKYTTLSEHVRYLPKDGKIIGISIGKWRILNSLMEMTRSIWPRKKCTF